MEISDFYHMPLKGHARNMVSSYARYLGLDSEEVTKQFLREYHDFENRGSRRDSSSESTGTLSTSQINAHPLPIQHVGNPTESQSARSMWDRPIPSSELSRGYDSRSSSAQRVANAASRRHASMHDDRLSRRSGNGSYPSRPSLPLRVFGFIFRSPVVVLVVLIVVLIAGFALWAVLANSCRAQENELIPMTKTGSLVTNDTPVDDTSTDDALTPSGSEQETASNPNVGPFELVVAPVEGTAPWTEVTVDGESVCAETLSETKTWQVTTGCTVSTAQPGNLKVTRNGEEVTLEHNSETGAGSVELTVQTESSDAADLTNQENQTNQEAAENG
jgi:cytoskeletal protein RodZ